MLNTLRELTKEANQAVMLQIHKMTISHSWIQHSETNPPHVSFNLRSHYYPLIHSIFFQDTTV